MTCIVPGNLAFYNLLEGQRDLTGVTLVEKPLYFHSLKITVLCVQEQKSLVSPFLCLFTFIPNTQR